MSLKNFIMRKGKSTSVDLGEGAKEEEEAAEEGEAAAEGGADAEAATTAEEANDKDAGEAEKTPKQESGGEAANEAENTPAEAPVTNGENGCSNGTAEENATHNHQEQEEKTTGNSPVKKSKEAGGVKEEANAKIINTTAAVNSGELEHAERDCDEQRYSSRDGETNNRHQRVPALTNHSSNRPAASRPEPELALAVSREQGGEGGEAQAPQCDGCHSDDESRDQGEGKEEEEGDEEEEEEMRKRHLREAAVAIVQDVMSAATDQLEKELCVDNGVNGCCGADSR